ncbi:hypothetical protein Tco_0856854 [Tanacetum coccineum]|uniref:Uncharacterized protein n=1 Tax=Tanacetum coccineum TaxID=301880 RepID=A0ABQ5B6P2_9ASTR
MKSSIAINEVQESNTLHHDGIFIGDPLRYVQGDMKQLTDYRFDGMYNVPLNICIKELKTDANVEEFLTLSKDSDISDEYDSSEEDDDLEYVDFQTEGEENVVIPNVTTTNPFLNKLCSNNGYFRRFIDELVHVDNIPEVDLDESNIADRFKIKKGVTYLKDVEAGRCVDAYSKRKVQKKLFVDVDDVEGLSDQGKSKIPNSKPSPKPKSKPSPKPKSKISKAIKTKTVTFRKPILTRSMKNGEPIAWAVVMVENQENWCWFLGLLHDDLNLQYGCGLTLISDSHKGLHDAVGDWQLEAEHKKCTRHNQINGEYVDYLVQRNLNSWSSAFFMLDVKWASFENGILGPMLEDVRVYIIKRLVVMSKLAQNLEDIITPIRKHLDNLKKEQRMWELSGLPCVHAVAGFMHLNNEPYEGVRVVELVQVVIEGSSAGGAGSSVGGASLSTGRGNS